MCMARTHFLCGAAVGLAAGTLAHLHPEPLIELTAVTASFAGVPDMDQVGSCASRSLGFVSSLLARVVRRLSGGHRHATHSLVFCTAVAGLAVLGAHYRHGPAGRIWLALLLALAATTGARALGIPGHLDDLAALAGAVAMAWTGWGLALVPLGAGLGCLAHLIADACTNEGVPALWPLLPTRRHVRLLPEPFAFSTGSRPEKVFAFVMVAALILLASHAAGLPFPHLTHGHLAL